MGLQSANNSLENFKLGLYTSGDSPPGESLLNGMLWYYKLEEASGTPRADSSLNSNSLAEGGTVASNPGVIGDAASYNGLPVNRLSNTFETIYDLSATDFTITGWINIAALDIDTKTMLYIGTGASNVIAELGLFIFYDGAGAIVCGVSNGVSTGFAATPSTGLTASTWHFINVRYNITTGDMDIQFDGNASTIATPINAPQSQGTQSLVLGNQVTDNEQMAGKIDEVGGWDRLLTDEEIAFLYNSGMANRPDFATTQPLVDDEGNTLVDDEGNILVFDSGTSSFNLDFNLDFEG